MSREGAYAAKFVSLFEQQFRQGGTILSGYTGDKGFFHSDSQDKQLFVPWPRRTYESSPESREGSLNRSYLAGGRD